MRDRYLSASKAGFGRARGPAGFVDRASCAWPKPACSCAKSFLFILAEKLPVILPSQRQSSLFFGLKLRSGAASGRRLPHGRTIAAPCRRCAHRRISWPPRSWRLQATSGAKAPVLVEKLPVLAEKRPVTSVFCKTKLLFFGLKRRFGAAFGRPLRRDEDGTARIRRRLPCARTWRRPDRTSCGAPSQSVNLDPVAAS
jgi:hypothetical protein